MMKTQVLTGSADISDYRKCNVTKIVGTGITCTTELKLKENNFVSGRLKENKFNFFSFIVMCATAIQINMKDKSSSNGKSKLRSSIIAAFCSCSCWIAVRRRVSACQQVLTVRSDNIRFSVKSTGRNWRLARSIHRFNLAS